MALKRVVGVGLTAGGIALMFGATAQHLLAGPDENTLVVEGQEIVTKVEPKSVPLSELFSGWRFRSAETQALQTDDFENPAFAFVENAIELWTTKDGAAGKSCADCHNDVEDGMKGVRAGMPKRHKGKGRPLTLEQHVNFCRTERMQPEPWKWESNEMLGTTVLIGVQSRGMPMKVQTDGGMKPWIEKGKKLYYTRHGQLDLACVNCHENNYGSMIRADHVSQGHINGFPTYRLKWQKLGSLHRRFNGCMRQIRAQPYKRGSDEFVALELYLATRGAGLSIESPAVRN